MARNIIPRRPGSLKEATRNLVSECGGIDAVMAELGVSRSLVYGWTAEDEEGQSRFISAEHVRRLERVAGRPIVTAWLAAEHGCAVVHLGDNRAAVPALTESFAALTKAAGETISDIAIALSDGRLTQQEAAVGRRDLQQLGTVVANLIALLAPIAEGEKPANVTAIPVKGKVG